LIGKKYNGGSIMAQLHIDFYSKSLNRLVSMKAIIPIDRVNLPGVELSDEKPMQSLYLLHGFSGNNSDWISGSHIQELALKYNLAVFMPNGENHFYIDDKKRSALYSEFIGLELIEFTRKMFNLSHEKEDTFIGGFSMGGYGAIYNGLKYTENFGKIIGFSSALIIKDIEGISEVFKDAIADYNYYTSVFGDLDQIIESEINPEWLIKKMQKDSVDIPKIFIRCGKDDFLLEQNRDFHNFLCKENIPVVYNEVEGTHDWAFCNRNLEPAIQWLVEK
jgi:S-formylglutathione hydrolase FrmB